MCAQQGRGHTSDIVGDEGGQVNSRHLEDLYICGTWKYRGEESDLLCVEIPLGKRVEKRLKVGGKAWWRRL